MVLVLEVLLLMLLRKTEDLIERAAMRIRSLAGKVEARLPLEEAIAAREAIEVVLVASIAAASTSATAE